MKAIRYFSKNGALHQLVVEDGLDRDHLRVGVWFVGEKDVPSFKVVALNVVQVDKPRQQFHGWLHERANGPDGANWQEAE